MLLCFQLWLLCLRILQCNCVNLLRKMLSCFQLRLLCLKTINQLSQALSFLVKALKASKQDCVCFSFRTLLVLCIKNDLIVCRFVTLGGVIYWVFFSSPSNNYNRMRMAHDDVIWDQRCHVPQMFLEKTLFPIPLYPFFPRRSVSFSTSIVLIYCFRRDHKAKVFDI